MMTRCMLQEFLEYGKILTEEDFERIKKLRHRKMVEAVMKKHGLKSASKRDRMLAEAEEEAEEALTEKVLLRLHQPSPHPASCNEMPCCFCATPAADQSSL